MADNFKTHQTGLESPGQLHFSVSPNDNTDLAIRPRALRIGGAGNIAVVDAAGTEITYTVAAGEVLLFRAVRVKSTGTTATGIVGWY